MSRRQLLITVSFLFLMIPTFSFAQTYTLVWADEFDSTAVNTNEWEYEVNGNGGGNNELQYYTANPTNSFLSAGVFKIMALKQAYLGKTYTSARLHTKKSWKYGKVEARLKLPFGKGIWPAFWMLGSNINTVSWPACGEIDIMEMIGGTTTASGGDGRVFGTAHWSNNGAHASYGLSYALPSGKLSDDFHTYSIIWDAKQIMWYIDNIKYCTIDIQPAGLSAFRAPFFIILNLAVGGNWPGSPDATTTFPQLMEVDYVRVYQNIPTGIQRENVQLKGFALEQNFPNPFNPSTSIRYHVPASSHVTLTVTDLLGRDVATLVNGRQDAGVHELPFDGSHLTSGVYLYRLTADGTTMVRRMQMVK